MSSFGQRATLLCLCLLGIAPGIPVSAQAMTLPDPSGVYEGQCSTGPAFFPVRCEDQPTPATVRARATLFAREFIPEDCSTQPCSKAKTTIEGQIVVVRYFTGYGAHFDEAEQKCKFPPDLRSGWLGDVYDVEGEVEWTDFQSNGNALTLTGEIVSDPGDLTYIPKMKFTGLYLLGSIPAATSINACMDLVDVPALDMNMIFDAPPGNDPPPKCSGTSGYPVSRCWRRLSGPIPTAAGTIRGTVVSLVPTYTETDNEVHQATLVVYEQQGGPVREQMPEESDQDYAAHLIERGRKEIKRVQIERRRDGTYTLDGPGKFEIGDLPAFHFRSEAGGRWGTVWYTVEVEGAETDEEVPLEGGGTELNRLHFATGRAVNVRPEDPPLSIGVDAFGGLEAKRQLIDSLLKLCLVQYSEAEQAAEQFVLDAETDGLTPEVDEAIRRAVWAERAALAGRNLADELITTALEGLGTLLADLYDDLSEFHRGDIAFLRNSRDRLKTPVDPLAASSFSLSSVEPPTQLIADTFSYGASKRLLAHSDLASLVKKGLKGQRPVFVLELQLLGLSNAEAIVDAFLGVVEVIADSIETRTLAGGGKSLVKLLIAEAIKSSKLVLLDVTPISYCGITEDSAQTSVEQMSMWNSSNEEVYTKDRREVVQIIDRMNRDASNLLARMRASQEIANGLDTVQDAAEVLGTVFKWVKAVEKFAQFTKYALNANSVILPFAEAYGTVPGHVEDAVNAAYAQASPFSIATGGDAAAQSGPPVFTPPRAPAAQLSVAIGATALLAVLEDIDLALAEDDIGAVMALVVDAEEPSYVPERDKYDRAAQAIFAQAGAATGAYDLAAPLREAGDDFAAAQTAHAEFSDVLQRMVVDIYSGVYDQTTDAGYVRARGSARILLGVLRSRLTALNSSLLSLREAAESNGLGPAVLLEALAPVSTTTQDGIVSTSPETFVFSARITNLGEAELSGLSLHLEARSPLDSLQVVGGADQAVATLQPLDGLENGGADEAVVEWQVTYAGDFAWELLRLEASLLQNGETPPAGLAVSTSIVLPMDAAVADEDGDGLPDDFETTYGLNLQANDAAADPDSDGLSNLAELRLSTDPSESDSDGDGLLDGAEFVPDEQGFATDPLTADTDGDGADDSSDGAPIDESTTSAPPANQEPSVSLSRTLVVLTQESPVAAVRVSNGGAGTLVWSAMPESTAILATSPSLDDMRGEGDLLFVTLADGVETASVGSFVSSVAVADAAGTVHDSAKVKVVFGEQAGAAVCGHGLEASIGSRLTASDALATLRAAVGTIECDACRCDVDLSGGVTAVDALRVLRAAVGIASELTCPAC